MYPTAYNVGLLLVLNFCIANYRINWTTGCEVINGLFSRPTPKMAASASRHLWISENIITIYTTNTRTRSRLGIRSKLPDGRLLVPAETCFVSIRQRHVCKKSRFR